MESNVWLKITFTKTKRAGEQLCGHVQQGRFPSFQSVAFFLGLVGVGCEFLGPDPGPRVWFPFISSLRSPRTPELAETQS